MKAIAICTRSSLIAVAVLLCRARPGFARGPGRFDVSEHGAVGDGKTLNTRAIQQAIDDCAAAGGTVVIPKGVFVSGSLFLKPGVDLDLLDGGVLKGSTDIKDYPEGRTRVEGHSVTWPAALLNGDRVDHLRITGPGTLDGSGPTFWAEFLRRRQVDHGTTNLSVARPRMAFIQNSADVGVSGVAFINSGFWNLHLYRCHDVTVDHCQFRSPFGVTGRAPSTDGIDVDSSRDVTIANSTFAVGDDCIALKGSKGPFAMRDADSPPVERIHIHDCTFESGGGIVTAGSEATVVRDVDVERCTTRKVTVLTLKLRPDTPQLYENFRLHDITVSGEGRIFNVAPWKQYFDLQGQPPPQSTVRGITVSGVKGAFGSFGRIDAGSGAAVDDVTIEDVDVTLKDGTVDVGHVKRPRLENVVINGKPVLMPATRP